MSADLATKEFVQGALAGVTTEFMFYGLDSYKVMKQAGVKPSLRQVYKGVLPVLVTGSGPSFGIFFACYGPLKKKLTEAFPAHYVAACTAASIVGGATSSLAGVPSDVIKKRVVLGVDASASAAARSVYSSSGIGGFMLGWQANLLKDVPFAAVKLSLYEGLAGWYLSFTGETVRSRPLTATEGALVGLVSGAITGVATTPLDCVNTRVKSGELSHFSLTQAHVHVLKHDGPRALFRGVVPRTLIMGLGSTVFWGLYARVGVALGKE